MPVVFSAGLDGDSAPSLFYLHDDSSGLDFLVDTGASVSLFPHQGGERRRGPQLKQADGSALPCWGRRRLSPCFGGRVFSFDFLLAGVDRPILGMDFLAKFKWLVDVPGRQVLDSATCAPIFLVLPGGVDDVGRVAHVDAPASVQKLLGEFQEVVGASFSDLKPQHGVEHHIVTTGLPVHAKYRRLDQAPLKLSSAGWSRPELFAAQMVLGRPLCTWSLNQMVVGDLPVISVV